MVLEMYFAINFSYAWVFKILNASENSLYFMVPLDNSSNESLHSFSLLASRNVKYFYNFFVLCNPYNKRKVKTTLWLSFRNWDQSYRQENEKDIHVSLHHWILWYKREDRSRASNHIMMKKKKLRRRFVIQNLTLPPRARIWWLVQCYGFPIPSPMVTEAFEK